MNRAFYLAMLPWPCFVVADRTGGISAEQAAMTSAGLALVIAAAGFWRRGLRALEVMAVVIFAAEALAAPRLPAGMRPYDRASVVAALAVGLLLSLAFEPATSAYTRDMLSPARWSSPQMVRGDQLMTARWAMVVAACAASLAAGPAIGTATALTLFDWLVPIGLVSLAAVAGSPVGCSPVGCSPVGCSPESTAGSWVGGPAVAGPPVPAGPVAGSPGLPAARHPDRSRRLQAPGEDLRTALALFDDLAFLGHPSPATGGGHGAGPRLRVVPGGKGEEDLPS